MRTRYYVVLAIAWTLTPVFAQSDPGFVERMVAMESQPGLFTVHRDHAEGRLYLTVDDLDSEFLLVDSLPHGLGSNDVGLDRGKLGTTRLVRWRRVGPRLFLEQRNLAHRAETDNAAERRAVEQGFARSVVAGFDIELDVDGRLTIDVTNFCLRDAFGVGRTLDGADQGSYSLERDRSFVVFEECRSFPRNTELTVDLTFAGGGRGSEVRRVAPDAKSVTLRQRLSLIALPEPGYEPRAADPRSGYFSVSWQDYAVPLGAAMGQARICRHRLTPGEPLVYYVDSGAPEPVRSALVEGASWWSEAFAAAGFPDTFKVEVLPADADPMDVRYHVIQWVHRSSRGWSYGSSIVDPRTGEILKGHVSLGSRRVRQDRLIAQALVGPDADRCDAMALARLRQLAAHEVGHTLGLSHNFAASTTDRASVMDYPHPRLKLGADGEVDLSAAYDVGIGEWDKFAIRWGYGASTPDERQQMIAQARADGMWFASDSDARSVGSMHPAAHLWDEGADPVTGLREILAIRKHAMERFGPSTLFATDAPEKLDELLTPLYLMHRYQVEAAVKLVGGVDYARRGLGDAVMPSRPVPSATQNAALDAILATLRPEALEIPEAVAASIPVRTHGDRRRRELLPTNLGAQFDRFAAAESLVDRTFALLLHRSRAARLVAQADQPGLPTLQSVVDRMVERLLRTPWSPGYASRLQSSVARLLVAHLERLALDGGASAELRTEAAAALQFAVRPVLEARAKLPSFTARQLLQRIDRVLEEPELRPTGGAADLPPGAPIGDGQRALWWMDDAACACVSCSR